MASVAINHSARAGGAGCSIPWVMIFAGILVALAMGVVVQTHAEKHDEAATIRRCLDQNGPYMIMKHKYDPTYYLVCQIDKSTWGFQAVKENGIEKTAFCPGGGTFAECMSYLQRIAVRFKGTLPWLH